VARIGWVSVHRCKETLHIESKFPAIRKCMSNRNAIAVNTVRNAFKDSIASAVSISRDSGADKRLWSFRNASM